MSINVSDATARVYAKALLEIGAEQGNTDSLIEDLNLVMQILKEAKDFRAQYESPKVPKEEKYQMLDRVFGGHIEKELLSLLKVLTRKGREKALDSIVAVIQELRDIAENIVHVDIESASPLAEDILENLKTKLEAVTGKRPSIHETVKKELIGGIVLRVGDMVLDGSIRSRLAGLRRQTTSA